MDEIVSGSTARADFNMLLLTIFGVSSLALAAIGIYGLMAYSVEQRTQEIGIRMALGAGHGSVGRMILLEGLKLAVIGTALGLVASFGLTPLIASFLFGVKPVDPLIFTLAPMLLVGVAVVAIWIPALRATRVDPMDALRCD